MRERISAPTRSLTQARTYARPQSNSHASTAAPAKPPKHHHNSDVSTFSPCCHGNNTSSTNFMAINGETELVSVAANVKSNPSAIAPFRGLANANKRNSDDIAGGAADGAQAEQTPSSVVINAPQLGQTVGALSATLPS
ncbi:MAG: hypothetical protein QM811_30060 [Pirellulales bacterium]